MAELRQTTAGITDERKQQNNNPDEGDDGKVHLKRQVCTCQILIKKWNIEKKCIVICVICFD